MGHRLKLVVDEELGGHHDESKGEEEAIAGAQNKAVPALVFIVDHRVNAVAECQREERHPQISKSHPEEKNTLILILYIKSLNTGQTPWFQNPCSLSCHQV